MCVCKCTRYVEERTGDGDGQEIPFEIALLTENPCASSPLLTKLKKGASKQALAPGLELLRTLHFKGCDLGTGHYLMDRRLAPPFQPVPIYCDVRNLPDTEKKRYHPFSPVPKTSAELGQRDGDVSIPFPWRSRDKGWETWLPVQVRVLSSSLLSIPEFVS